MFSRLKDALKRGLVRSQKHTGLDMLYLAQGGFWTTLGFGATGVVSLLLAIVFANLLPKETYGSYKYVLSIGGLFGFLTLTGMNAAVGQAVARGQLGALTYAVRFQLKWNLLFTAALGAGAAWYLWHGNATLGWSLLVLGVLTPIASAFTTYPAFFGGRRDFRRSALYSTVSIALYAAAMTVALLLTRDVLTLVIVYAAVNAAIPVLFHLMIVARFRPTGLDEEERAKMVRLGSHLTLTNVLATVSQYLDGVIVFKFVGAADLAVFAFAGVMPERVRSFLKRGVAIATPKLAVMSLEATRKSLTKRLAQGAAIGALLAGLYALVAPFVFRYVFPQYEASVLYSQLIALNFILVIPTSYAAYVMQSQHFIRQIYQTSTAANVARIAAVAVGGWLFGVLGVVVGRLIANAAGLAISLAVLYRHAAAVSRQETVV